MISIGGSRHHIGTLALNTVYIINSHTEIIAYAIYQTIKLVIELR